MNWFLDMEGRLLNQGFLDNLGLCDCGQHNIVHVNPDGLQALYVLLAAFAAETTLEGDVSDLPKPILEQIERMPEEIQGQAAKAVTQILNITQQQDFDGACRDVLQVLREFLPELEDWHD